MLKHFNLKLKLNNKDYTSLNQYYVAKQIIGSKKV